MILLLRGLCACASHSLRSVPAAGPPVGDCRPLRGRGITSPVEALPPAVLEASEPPSEEPLLARLRAGDETAYEEVVRRHAGLLLQVARRLLGNDEDAQDAVQECLLSAFRSIESFQGQARLSTWLHRIVVNASLMRLRKRRRTHEVSIEALLPRYREDGHAVEPPAPWRADVAGLEAAEIREKVRQCIDQLPEAYRAVILLRDIEGLDTEETARLLDATRTAVKVRLHRARQALRALLNPYFAEVAAG